MSEVRVRPEFFKEEPTTWYKWNYSTRCHPFFTLFNGPMSMVEDAKRRGAIGPDPGELRCLTPKMSHLP